MMLDWKKYDTYEEATLANPDGSVGVRFSLAHQPTCYRRGRWRLLIEVTGGQFHDAWGCFDYQDQPMRYYHSYDCAKRECEEIATVLHRDFKPERAGA